MKNISRVSRVRLPVISVMTVTSVIVHGGSGERSRTSNLRFTKPLLCRLSYASPFTPASVPAEWGVGKASVRSPASALLRESAWMGGVLLSQKLVSSGNACNRAVENELMDPGEITKRNREFRGVIIVLG